jgi:hypothetical protein
MMMDGKEIRMKRDDQFILFLLCYPLLFDFSYITFLTSPKGLISG